MYFLYDGTYPGFLTAVYEIYHFGTSTMERLTPDRGEDCLFGEQYRVETQFLKAEKVVSAFEKKCGMEAVRWMYRAFLSDEEGKELKIFYFIREGFKTGKQIYARRKEPWIQDILAMNRKVGNEAEKFRGILRFSELEDGFLYAVIRPQCCILPILAVHFKDRFSQRSWGIYDSLRHEAAVYQNGRISMVNIENINKNINYSASEKDFRELWQNYYRHMGIEERRNPRERMSFLPKKYWAYLTEMKDPYNRQDLPLKGMEERKKNR